MDYPAFESGLYMRVPVNLDLAGALPERILGKRRLLNFFVDISHEKVPLFYTNCWSIGHSEDSYRRASGIIAQGEVNLQTTTGRNGINRGWKRNANSNPLMQTDPSIAATQNVRQETSNRGDKWL